MQHHHGDAAQLCSIITVAPPSSAAGLSSRITCLPSPPLPQGRRCRPASLRAVAGLALPASSGRASPPPASCTWTPCQVWWWPANAAVRAFAVCQNSGKRCRACICGKQFIRCTAPGSLPGSPPPRAPGPPLPSTGSHSSGTVTNRLRLYLSYEWHIKVGQAAWQLGAGGHGHGGPRCRCSHGTTWALTEQPPPTPPCLQSQTGPPDCVPRRWAEAHPDKERSWLPDEMKQLSVKVRCWPGAC